MVLMMTKVGLYDKHQRTASEGVRTFQACSRVIVGVVIMVIIAVMMMELMML